MHSSSTHDQIDQGVRPLGSAIKHARSVMRPDLSGRCGSDWVVVFGEPRVGGSARLVFGREDPLPGVCDELRVSCLRAGRGGALDHALRASGAALLRPVLASLHK